MGGKYNPNGRRPGRNVEVQRAAIDKDPDLGKISDSRMADRYGVSRFVAADVRRRRNIPPARTKKQRKTPALEKLNKYESWLGVYYDTHIARELRINGRTVQRYRKSIGRAPGKLSLPNVQSMLLNLWKRPKGIDVLLDGS